MLILPIKKKWFDMILSKELNRITKQDFATKVLLTAMESQLRSRGGCDFVTAIQKTHHRFRLFAR